MKVIVNICAYIICVYLCHLYMFVYLLYFVICEKFVNHFVFLFSHCHSLWHSLNLYFPLYPWAIFNPSFLQCHSLYHLLILCYLFFNSVNFCSSHCFLHFDVFLLCNLFLKVFLYPTHCHLLLQYHSLCHLLIISSNKSMYCKLTFNFIYRIFNVFCCVQKCFHVFQFVLH